VYLVASAGAALAQQSNDDAPAPPPPADNSGMLVAPPPAAEACVPACRSGYLCQQGVCISACNPPCAAGERCTANGECAAVAPAPPAYYTPPEPVRPPPDPGFEKHDGFMLRLSFGLGGASMTESVEDSDFVADGVSGSFGVDIGATIATGVVLHARLADFVIFDPNLSVDDQDLGSLENGNVGAVLLAPAITYYFMPANFYLTAAVGISWINARNFDTDSAASSDIGFGLNFDLGKEWWVSGNWGFGAGARFWFTSAQEETPVATSDLSFIGLAALFSATYQ
jgi:hypothetical protein